MKRIFSLAGAVLALCLALGPVRAVAADLSGQDFWRGIWGAAREVSDEEDFFWLDPAGESRLNRQWRAPDLPITLFPENNFWNTTISHLPVHAQSDVWVNAIGRDEWVHPDFNSGDWPEGSGQPIGIPFDLVTGSQARVRVSFLYADESDPGPYPIPRNASMEAGPYSDGDRHVIVVDWQNKRLYEMWNAWPRADGSWQAGSGAVWDLTSNDLRPDGWTAADAAGFPMLAGMVRYQEVASGEINHAIRFTAPDTRDTYIWPATHWATWESQENYPPFGARFRLKASVDISGFSPETQVILRAMRDYGMVLADNGAPWFISGAPDDRWIAEHLMELRRLTGNDFEAVDTSSMMISSDSAEARQP